MELTTANKPALIGTKKKCRAFADPTAESSAWKVHGEAHGRNRCENCDPCQPLQTMIACGLPLS
jgi:hypothetical protein